MRPVLWHARVRTTEDGPPRRRPGGRHRSGGRRGNEWTGGAANIGRVRGNDRAVGSAAPIGRVAVRTHVRRPEAGVRAPGADRTRPPTTSGLSDRSPHARREAGLTMRLVTERLRTRVPTATQHKRALTVKSDLVPFRIDQPHRSSDLVRPVIPHSDLDRLIHTQECTRRTQGSGPPWAAPQLRSLVE